MKRIIIVMVALLAILGIMVFNRKETVTKEDLIGKTFMRDKGGFGGSFTITFNKDGTYSYYEGALSSYIGFGKWSIENNVITLQERGGYAFTFCFGYEDKGLIYLAEKSDEFIYVKVADGERFSLKPDF